MAKLVLWLPDGSIHDIVLDKERLTIGRRPDNDVCLPYPAVSGEHAVVVTILADSFLEDLGSTNGTLVNGKPVAKHFLRENDLIDIGRHRLMYFSRDDINAEPIPPDILRQQVRGLHEQVERARSEREERRNPEPDAAPRELGRADPLLADEDLLAELESAALPGMPAAADAEPVRRSEAIMPARAVDSAAGSQRRDSDRPPVLRTGNDAPASREREPAAVKRDGGQASPRRTSRSSSTVAARLASTWSPEPYPGDVASSNVVEADANHESDAGTATAAGDDPAPEAGYGVRVLTGPSAGRQMKVTRGELSVGRVGTQVARIAASGETWRLTAVEGAEPLELNGAAVPADGAELAPGDRFRVAGAEIVFERR